HPPHRRPAAEGAPACLWCGVRARDFARTRRCATRRLRADRSLPRRGRALTDSVDVLIVGGGIAGASLGAALAGRRRVLMLEREAVAGYHATGRSVAFWEESYGGPAVQPLTTASGPMLDRPDPDLADHSFLSPRRTLHIGRAGDTALRDS